MKTRYILFIFLMLALILADAAPRFKKHQWVYWTEVNFTGQKFIQVGMIVQGKRADGTYRILSNEGWKMHLKGDLLTLVPKKK